MHDLMDLQDCGSRIPYAEWYLNALRIPGSATATYHEATYGTDVPYTAFQKPFEDYARSVDFGQWAEFFRTVGAKYVVMVTKHLDGYTLWPTQIKHPRRKDTYGSREDLIGKVTSAVRASGLKMGAYYSGGTDWTCIDTPIRTLPDFMEHQVLGKDYREYATTQWLELIERYQPSLLWNDMGFPPDPGLNTLFAHYYNTIEDGLINDRWSQINIPANPIVANMWDDPKGALPHGEYALELARASNDRELEARSLSSLGLIHIVAEDFEEAIHCLEASLALYALLGNEQSASREFSLAPFAIGAPTTQHLAYRASEALCWAVLAIAQVYGGQVSDSKRSGRRALALSQAIKNVWVQINSTNSLTYGLLDAGAYEEALERMQHVFALAQSLPLVVTFRWWSPSNAFSMPWGGRITPYSSGKRHAARSKKRKPSQSRSISDHCMCLSYRSCACTMPW